MAKVLIIDDDLELSQIVKDELVRAQWAVEIANNGADGLQLLKNFTFDLIILDWHMPDIKGIDVLKQFRQGGGTTPVIFLTGEQSIENKEAGLDSGADDYLTKPFSLRELMARVRAVQRRPHDVLQSSLTIRGAELKVSLKVLQWQDKTVKLSSTELAILEFMMRHPDQLFASAQLFARVWPTETDAKEDTVRVHMHVLRRKLSLAGVPDLIQTVKGSGYILKSDA